MRGKDMKSSAVPNFFKLSIDERVAILKEFLDLSEEETMILKNLCTLGFNELEAIGENPISNYELPLRIANYFKINGKDYFIPMVVEEASVVAGACYGAKLCYKSGGIESQTIKNSEYGKAIGQIQLINVKNPEEAERKILKNKDRLLEKANEGHKHSRAYDIKLRQPRTANEKMLIVNIYIDPGDAMGAAVASQMAEAVAKEISRITAIPYNACIISNYSGRHVKAEAKVHVENLARKSASGKWWTGEEVRDGIVWLSRWAENDVYRATTHNKGIMNGVDAVALATGQDWRAIESANHVFAMRTGRYKPLSVWYSEDNYLVGRLEMLIPCGIVGGEIKKLPKAEFALRKILKVKSADELAEIMAAVGLAQNLAALSMLATIGLKEGHEPHRKISK
ncbi:hydroxymethylglutaryl-CoA reductase, degradative [Candidatus Bathyarchaeota archaeon]|nr:MAG: hydroxymethylglutaryl-CoA reductase, degradative [Candidatus Bathyarchaeota archaeon]